MNESTINSKHYQLTYLRPEVAALKRKLEIFVNERCIPCEHLYEEHVAQFHGADRWSISAIPPCLAGKLNCECHICMYCELS